MGGRALAGNAGVGCVIAIAWLILTAVRGGDLGAPTGVLVGMLLVVVAGLVLARRGDPLEAWLWRHARRATQEFSVARPVADVIDAVAALAWRRRGWRPTVRDCDGGLAVLTTRMTAFSWKKRIDVSARSAGDCSVVTVTSASPQLYDWGENRRVVLQIRRELEGQ